jgi:hypothetical protein
LTISEATRTLGLIDFQRLWFRYETNARYFERSRD